MKKVLITMIAAGAFAFTSKAQIQIGAQGSYLKGTGDNTAKLWGGGVHAKFFLGKNLALGAKVNAYPSTVHEVTNGNIKYSQKNVVTNVVATLDYSLSKNDNMLQPYIGVDGGLNLGNQIVTYTYPNNSQNVSNTNNASHFALAPKVGVNIGLGQTFGIFGQAQYWLLFGDKNAQNLSITGVPNPITTPALSKFFTLDAGIYVRLVGANKAR